MVTADAPRGNSWRLSCHRQPYDAVLLKRLMSVLLPKCRHYQLKCRHFVTTVTGLMWLTSLTGPAPLTGLAPLTPWREQ